MRCLSDKVYQHARVDRTDKTSTDKVVARAKTATSFTTVGHFSLTVRPIDAVTADLNEFH